MEFPIFLNSLLISFLRNNIAKIELKTMLNIVKNDEEKKKL